MAALTAKQRETLLFLQRYEDRHGMAPSYAEICDELDLASKSGVNRLMNALEERGYIHRLHHRARAITILQRIPDPEKPTAISAAAAYRDVLRRISVGGVVDPVGEARHVLERYP